MKTLQAMPSTSRKSSQPTAIRITLYDLIAALDAEVGADEENVLTAAVVHILNTHRVTCTGDLEGYRMVCDTTARSAGPRQCENALLLHFERADNHFERGTYKEGATATRAASRLGAGSHAPDA